MADQLQLKRFREKLRLSTIIIYMILCLMVLMMVGCSESHNRALALWVERRMEDDQRIYGNPYETSEQQHYILFHITY